MSATLAVVQRRALVVALVGFFLGGTLPGVLGIFALFLAERHPGAAQILTAIAWMLTALAWLLMASILLLLALGGLTLDRITP